MLAIIGGSGLTQLACLELVRREVVRTPYGDPSGYLTYGRIGDATVVFLARHGYGHTLSPHEVNYRANIWGHTDNLGDPEENLRLSERRAEAVRDGLIQAGVPADRLRSKGWGASRPLESNASEAGRARNRRTECVIDVQ